MNRVSADRPLFENAGVLIRSILTAARKQFPDFAETHFNASLAETPGGCDFFPAATEIQSGHQNASRVRGPPGPRFRLPPAENTTNGRFTSFYKDGKKGVLLFSISAVGGGGREEFHIVPAQKIAFAPEASRRGRVKQSKLRLTVHPRGGTSFMAWHQVDTIREIHSPIGKVFDYVTKPHLWHKWHPASLNADTEEKNLKPGDTFSENVKVMWLKSPMDYKVLEVKEPVEWKVQFRSGIGNGTIHYRLQSLEDGTEFHRTLAYDPNLLLYKYVLFWLVRPFMRWQSAHAVDNLKKYLEENFPAAG